MSRKAIKGVLHNFLGTYTSRYSDYDGYWLFGMLIGELEQFSIDLLETDCKTSGSAPMAAAVQLAATKFKEQMEKAGLSLSCIREAKLALAKTPDLRSGYVNGRSSAGFDLNFAVIAVSPGGMTYECKKSVFVAPHDPEVELRSVRGT
jgi:hypothetical protein